MRTINAHLTDYGRLKHFVRLHSILEKFMRKNSGQENQVQAHIHWCVSHLKLLYGSEPQFPHLRLHMLNGDSTTCFTGWLSTL